MSILHFGINSMKGILKMASQLDFKEHEARGEENQNLRDIRKAKNIKKLGEKLSIHVDYWFNVTGMTHKLL